MEELKVRWKKAALENCTGVPCVVTPPAPASSCPTSTIPDIDGNPYNTVSIGTQCWTKENLRVRRYNDGTEIRFDASGTSTGTSSQTWNVSGREYGAHTIHSHDSTATTPSNLTSYGYLYNWYAAAGIVTSSGAPTKNICPIGWHVPTDTEWTTLTTYLGGVTTAWTVMKKNDALWTTNTGTNTSGFSALPGGARELDGSFGVFNPIRVYAVFWSSTLNSSGTLAWYRDLNASGGNVGKYTNDKSFGASVRCLLD